MICLFSKSLPQYVMSFSCAIIHIQIGSPGWYFSGCITSAATLQGGSTLLKRFHSPPESKLFLSRNVIDYDEDCSLCSEHYNGEYLSVKFIAANFRIYIKGYFLHPLGLTIDTN